MARSATSSIRCPLLAKELQYPVNRHWQIEDHLGHGLLEILSTPLPECDWDMEMTAS